MEHCGPKGTVLTKASRAKPYAGSDQTRKRLHLAHHLGHLQPTSCQVSRKQHLLLFHSAQRETTKNRNTSITMCARKLETLNIILIATGLD